MSTLVETNKTKLPTLVIGQKELKEGLERLDQELAVVLQQSHVITNRIQDVSHGGLPDSKILQVEDFELIQKWLPLEFQERKIRKVYNSVADGRSISTMEDRLKGHNGSIVVWKSANYGKVFGGFMDVDWTKYNGYFNSNRAFLFSINNKEKYEIKENGSIGYFDRNTWGPCFGKDLYITVSSFQGNATPVSYDFENGTKLAGGTTWTCEEMEIYTFEK